jgi:predicted cation transporter
MGFSLFSGLLSHFKNHIVIVQTFIFLQEVFYMKTRKNFSELKASAMCSLFRFNEKMREKVAAVMGFAFAYAMATRKQIFAADDFQGYDTDKSGADIVDNTVTVVGYIASFIGVIVLAAGIFQLIMAFRNEDSDGKSRAALAIGVGIALLSFGGIMSIIWGES